MKQQEDKVTIDAWSEGGEVNDLASIQVQVTGKRWKGSVTPDDVRDTWQTPPWLVSYFSNLVGGFDLDAASSDANAVCDLHYTKEMDALSFDWPVKCKAFLNPPYSDPKPWLEHVKRQVDLFNATVVMVLPDDISTKWFRIAVDSAAEMYGLVSDGKKTGRVAFVNPVTGQQQAGSNKGTFVMIFRRHTAPLKTTWLSRADMESANTDII